MSFGLPQRSSIMRLLSAAFLSCSFFNSSAAFLRSSNYELGLKKLFYHSIVCSRNYEEIKIDCAYSEFLLPVRCHETLLGLFSLGGLFETGADLRPLPVRLRLLPLLFLYMAIVKIFLSLECRALKSLISTRVSLTIEPR